MRSGVISVSTLEANFEFKLRERLVESVGKLSRYSSR